MIGIPGNNLGIARSTVAAGPSVKPAISTKETSDKIGEIVDKLIETPKEKKFRMGKFPIKKGGSKIEYDVNVTDYIVLDEIKQSLMDLHNAEQVKFGTETFKLI